MRDRYQRSVFRLALAVGAMAALLPTLSAQTPVPTIPYESAQYRYTVSLPSGCRHDEGPGTIDAICSADLDSDKSASAPAAASLVLEVTAERVAAPEGPSSGAALAEAFKEGDFRDELPEAVCGSGDKTRVKVDDVKQSAEAASVSYTAKITCPEMKFMGLGERLASVQYVITPGMRYRLFARAPSEQFAQSKTVIESFLTSFRVLPQNN